MCPIRSLQSAKDYLAVLHDQFNSQIDSCFQIISCQILLRADNTAIVMGDFVMKGTKVVIVPDKEQAEAADPSSASATGYLSEQRSSNVPNVLIRPFIFDGTIKLHVDMDRRIRHMDFIYNWGKPLDCLYK